MTHCVVTKGLKKRGKERENPTFIRDKCENNIRLLRRSLDEKKAIEKITSMTKEEYFYRRVYVEMIYHLNAKSKCRYAHC